MERGRERERGGEERTEKRVGEEIRRKTRMSVVREEIVETRVETGQG